MSIRWRSDGRLVCAAMSKPEKGDTYIDDRLHYQLSVESRVILADVEHEKNGLWHWIHGHSLRACREWGGVMEHEKNEETVSERLDKIDLQLDKIDLQLDKLDAMVSY